MISGKLKDVCSLLKNKISYNGNFIGISIDTRTITKGAIFLCIEGDNFDGHNFITKAEEKGACAIIAHKKN